MFAVMLLIWNPMISRLIEFMFDVLVFVSCVDVCALSVFFGKLED